MQHFWVLLFEHFLPRVVGGLGELATDGSVVHFVFDAFQDGIGVWERTKLVFRIGWESVGFQDLAAFFFLLWICFPLDVAAAKDDQPFVSSGQSDWNASTYPSHPSLSRLNSSSRSPTALMADTSLLNSG